jgi:hypothetical protein
VEKSTPKEKASEMVEKYVDIQAELEETTQFYWGYAVKCALIAVDEILKLYYHLTDEFKYWQEVRLEISKL